MSSKRPLLLDFGSITNPVSLLVALTAYRESHSEIVVCDMNCKVDIDYGMFDKGDLRDEEQLDDFARISSVDVNSLELVERNLPLAVRLLQFAEREGFIRIVNTGNYKAMALDDLKSLRGFSDVDKHISLSIDFGPVNGAYETTFLATRRIFGYEDRRNVHVPVGIAAANGWDYSADGGRLQSGQAKVIAASNPLMDGGFTDILRRLDFGSFHDLQCIIEKPTFFADVIRATADSVEQRAYDEELRWFLPSVALDTATMGVFGHLKMLWKILSRSKRRK